MHRPLLLLAALLVVGCPHQKPPVVPPPVVHTENKEEPVVWRMSKSGLGFRIGDAEPERTKATTVARATPLSPEDAKKILDRLPAIQQDPSDTRDFALRAGSTPA